jgi:chromosome segregation ATPase
MESWLQSMKTKLSQQISKNTQVKKMVGELNHLNKEFAAKKTQINSFINVEKDKTVKQAQTKYNSLMKQINQTQKQLDKDVRKTVAQIKKSAWEIEKNLESYKDKLVAQKNKVEKQFSALKNSSGKKTSKKTATKTTAKKVRKTTAKSV